MEKEYIDHDYTDSIVCCHCGAEWDDSFEYGEGEKQCGYCEKDVFISVHESISYSTNCADGECLFEEYKIAGSSAGVEGKIYAKCKICEFTEFIDPKFLTNQAH